MRDEGFNNEIGVDLNTGFVYGGNVNNCGTWMDKMGSSEPAGNKGKPSTPRVTCIYKKQSYPLRTTILFLLSPRTQDGRAVEIVGLSYASLRGLSLLHDRGQYTYGAVERAGKDGRLVKWRLAEWADRIRDNFEKHFYIREKGKHLPEEKRPDLVNKTGIYKVTYLYRQLCDL